MRRNKKALFYNTLLSLLIVGLLSACQDGPVSDLQYPGGASGSVYPESGFPTDEDNLQVVYQVGDVFRELYDKLGGEDVLGPAISPISREGPLHLQYVENALFVYDENASPGDRLRLGSLGLEFGVAEKPGPPPSEPESRYVGGHSIWHEFIAIYDALGGVRYVGKPITEARFNSAKSRIEQYFENMGFYRLEEDEPGVVRLMAYGAFACDYRCRYHIQSASIPERQSFLPEQFQHQADFLGLQFTGKALTGVHLAADHMEEVIFENIVLYKDATKSSDVIARPIVEILGFFPHELVEPDPDPLMTFFEIQGGMGHNIPLLFRDYIQRHGGFKFSGPPLSEVFPVKSGVFRQCFKNLCLDYDLNADQVERLRLAPLGVRYEKEIFNKGADFRKSLSVKEVDLIVWEKFMRLPSGEPQEIFVLVSEDGATLKNREPVLFLSYPNSETKTFYFPPTGVDGLTSIRIPGIQASNGTLIAYKVCLMGFNGEMKCVGENYLIWNSN
jgi:hypothetical protein